MQDFMYSHINFHNLSSDWINLMKKKQNNNNKKQQQQQQQQQQKYHKE